MSSDCCAPERSESMDRSYRRVVWAALVINGAMFLVEIVAGLMAGSVSLQADALDFLGDVANYGISLLVIGMALRYRAKAALLKGATMGLFALWVVGAVVWHAIYRTLPHAITMGEVGCAALVCQCGGLRSALELAKGRQQYALRLALLTQRCDRKSRRVVRRSWSFWDPLRLA